jgi:hypothetical protein
MKVSYNYALTGYCIMKTTGSCLYLFVCLHNVEMKPSILRSKDNIEGLGQMFCLFVERKTLMGLPN